MNLLIVILVVPILDRIVEIQQIFTAFNDVL